jgi:hypothetical protein
MGCADFFSAIRDRPGPLDRRSGAHIVLSYDDARQQKENNGVANMP